MLAHLLKILRHLFLPHHSNNHRPKVLYPQSLTALAMVVMLANSSLPSLAMVRGGVLGYASDITIQEVLDQTNKRRIDNGLPALQIDNSLSDAARRKASDMFTFDYWAHINPKNGTEPWHFFDAVGYTYRYAGENLARDFGTTPPMVQAWIDSPSHRENLFSSHYVDTGIAVVNGTLGDIETTLVVQLFGARQAVAAAPKLGPASQVQAAGTSSQPDVSVTPVPHPTSVPVTTSSRELTTALARPLLSPLTVSKSIALSTLGLLAVVLVVDSVIVWRRRTHRLAGRNWAHFVFIVGLMAVVGTLSGGVIR